MKLRNPQSEFRNLKAGGFDDLDFELFGPWRVCDKNMGRFDNSFYLAYNLNAY